MEKPIQILSPQRTAGRYTDSHSIRPVGGNSTGHWATGLTKRRPWSHRKQSVAPQATQKLSEWLFKPPAVRVGHWAPQICQERSAWHIWARRGPRQNILGPPYLLAENLCEPTPHTPVRFTTKSEGTDQLTIQTYRRTMTHVLANNLKYPVRYAVVHQNPFAKLELILKSEESLPI